MKHPYSRAYQPSFPSLPVVLTNAEEELRTDVKNALIDTGSDATLAPMAFLAPVLSETRIRSHWGEWRAV